jgi:division protein 1
MKDTRFISGSGDHTLKLWDLDTCGNEQALVRQGETPLTFVSPGTDLYEQTLRKTFEGHTGGVSCLMFDDEWLISGSSDKTIRQWDMQTGLCVSVLQTSQWMEVEEHADVLIYGDHQRDWDQTKQTIEVYHIGGAVGCVNFWQHALASGYADGIIRLWDLRSGQCHRQLKEHTGSVTCLKFDDRIIVSGSVDKTVKVWDLRNGSVLQTISVDGSVSELDMDTRTIVVARSNHREMAVYSRSSGELYDLEVGHAKSVRCLKMVNQWGVSGGLDGTLCLWDLP